MYTPFFKLLAFSNSSPDPISLKCIEEINPLSRLAAADLQEYLVEQNDWAHNFGLDSNLDGRVIGKMFGVLVVQTKERQIGYLSAFSGKLAGSNTHSRFVPPVFDSLTEGSFLNEGMKELSALSAKIRALEDRGFDSSDIKALKEARRAHSRSLQQQLFLHYRFLNSVGEERDLLELFKSAGYDKPPAGAGECAAPKLLQAAFQMKMRPLALAEFWWGASPKSDQWVHGAYYPYCKEKCAPILAHMLGE